MTNKSMPMYNNTNYLYFLVLLILQLGTVTNGSSQPTINVIDAYAKKELIPMSDLVESVSYVVLESDSLRCGPANRVYANDSLIFVISFRQIAVFERSTGKFLRTIGSLGKGPNEFSSTISSMPFDDQMDIIRAKGWDYSSLEYNSLGSLNKKVNPKKISLGSIACLNESIYVTSPSKYGYEKESRLVLFDSNDKIIRKLPRHQKQEDYTTKIVGYKGDEAWFYKLKNELFFKETFNDTLWGITPNSIYPRYIFELGKLQPPKELGYTYDFKKLRNFIEISNLFESPELLFFTIKHHKLSFFAIYDKTKKSLRICDNADDSLFGLKNDIDNSFPFLPFSITTNNDLVGFIEAYELIEWKKNNPDLARKLPQKLKKVREYDNPIVVIATLKE
ncbi:6-bladed beta-propeller [Sunxiuqinia elliptica]|nr:6-bladed beta-propeller [Sunxiuqinia elliptica]